MIRFIKEHSQYIQWYATIYDIPFYTAIAELVDIYLATNEIDWLFYLEGIEEDYWSF